MTHNWQPHIRGIRLDKHGKLEVRLIASIWDWVCDMAEKSTERVREWTKNNMERRKEINRKAAKTYYDKNKNDPNFMDKRRDQKAEWARKNYKPTSELSPEELEERRRKNREAVKRYREAKKAQAAATEQQAKQEDK